PLRHVNQPHQKGPLLGHHRDNEGGRRHHLRHLRRQLLPPGGDADHRHRRARALHRHRRLGRTDHGAAGGRLVRGAEPRHPAVRHLPIPAADLPGIRHGRRGLHRAARAGWPLRPAAGDGTPATDFWYRIPKPLTAPRGSTFPGASPETRRSPMAGSSQNPRLLVLDDDDSVTFTICAIAEGAGFTTRATTNAGDFFQQLGDWQPSHIILDLQMPDIDGIEVLRRLADAGNDSVITITSGLGTRVLEAAARVAGENGLRIAGVLAKPFSAATLRNLLADSGESPKPKRQSPASGDVRVSSSEFTELKAGLDANQLVPFYQPKIACASGALVGFETLARWLHPKRGMVMPDRFIPLAERSGLIHPLTRQIFSQALAWFRPLFAGTKVNLALNMSPKLLSDPTFPTWLMEQCAREAVDPHQIILEITETSSMADPVQLLEYLTQLRIKGFHLSIDDFG